MKSVALLVALIVLPSIAVEVVLWVTGEFGTSVRFGYTLTGFIEELSRGGIIAFAAYKERSTAFIVVVYVALLTATETLYNNSIGSTVAATDVVVRFSIHICLITIYLLRPTVSFVILSAILHSSLNYILLSYDIDDRTVTYIFLALVGFIASYPFIVRFVRSRTS